MLKTVCIIATLMIAAGSAAAAPPEPGSERIRIAVSVVNYPGMPEQAACRMRFRAINESTSRVELSALVHTFDETHAGSGSWQVPTGTLEPGQAVERMYTCKHASFIRLDADNHYGWPGKCTIDGAAKAPCPVAVNVSANLPEPVRPKR